LPDEDIFAENVIQKSRLLGRSDFVCGTLLYFQRAKEQQRQAPPRAQTPLVIKIAVNKPSLPILARRRNEKE